MHNISPTQHGIGLVDHDGPEPTSIPRPGPNSHMCTLHEISPFHKSKSASLHPIGGSAANQHEHSVELRCTLAVENRIESAQNQVGLDLEIETAKLSMERFIVLNVLCANAHTFIQQKMQYACKEPASKLLKTAQLRRPTARSS